jgi:hypothetical protein
MELKDFQQRVLDTLEKYLDELTTSLANPLEIEKVKREHPGLDLTIPDYTEKAWGKLKTPVRNEDMGAYNPQTTISSALVYQKDWLSEMSGLVAM